MAKTITRPTLAPKGKADFEEAPGSGQTPEDSAAPKGRCDMEVWNSTFPRRAWREPKATARGVLRVRPAGHERQPVPPASGSSVTKLLGDIEQTYRASETAPGLCRTCDRLAGCTYPKPEGGVWHCDEFE